MYFSGNGEIDTDMDTNILDTNTDINTHINTDAYSEELEKLKNDPRIELMKKYRQHKNSTTYDHVCHVAEMSHKIEKGLHLHDIDEQAMLRGAVLHDYYQYDFRDHPIGPWRHGTSHAGQALENAEAAFELSDKEKDIIYSHMWPLNLTHLPHSREAWIVSVADKVCAVKEAVFHKNSLRQKRPGKK